MSSCIGTLRYLKVYVPNELTVSTEDKPAACGPVCIDQCRLAKMWDPICMQPQRQPGVLVKYFPKKCPSVFFLADVFMRVNALLDYQLFHMGRDSVENQSIALAEAGKLRTLNTHLRKLLSHAPNGSYRHQSSLQRVLRQR